MPYDLGIYDEFFFSTNQWEGLRHAEWLVPLLQDIFHPKSLVDVGCGTGHFGPKCEQLGISYVGLEGSAAGVERALAPVIQHDLRQLWPGRVKFDLALSIEVAEHIEGEFAGTFVDTLCALADTVVMTAAPPGQGGLKHVNEQIQPYWEELFAARGFERDPLTGIQLVLGIREAQMNGHHAATWFAPNIMCFRRRANANPAD